MKKNMLSIIILAVGILNVILGAVIVFAVVPTAIRTNNLIAQVAATVDLELEAKNGAEKKINIEDIENYAIDDIIITLKKAEDDTRTHYAQVSVSIALNKKAEDYEKLQPTVEQNLHGITEIISNEFEKYTADEVMPNKDVIKSAVLEKLQKDLYNPDFIVGLSFGETLVE